MNAVGLDCVDEFCFEYILENIVSILYGDPVSIGSNWKHSSPTLRLKGIESTFYWSIIVVTDPKKNTRY